MIAEPTIPEQKFYERRKACRKFLTATFEANRGGLDWESLSAEPGEGRLDILASALVMAMAIEDATESANEIFDGTSIIPNYIGNLHTRKALTRLTEQWMASRPSDAVLNARKLMMFADGGAKYPVVPRRGPIDGQCEPHCKIRESARILGGVTKAALAIGVTPATINGWIQKGQILNPKGELLFELAEIKLEQQRLASLRTES